MPKVIVKATPAPGLPGRWALGVGLRQRFNDDGSPNKDANGNQTYWPARSGVFFAAGQDQEITITDQELQDLQSGANAQLFAVVVTDPSAQPAQNEGGSSMVDPNQPGSTVPPGTTPAPTLSPVPNPTPAPGSPSAPAPGTGTPSVPTSPTETSPATKRAK